MKHHEIDGEGNLLDVPIQRNPENLSPSWIDTGNLSLKSHAF